MNTKKDTTIKIRISTQDKESIRATASQQQKTISTYVREEALKSSNR
jgi:predicted DNA binding CopG/RHH family protein